MVFGIPNAKSGIKTEDAESITLTNPKYSSDKNRVYKKSRFKAPMAKPP